MAAFMFFGTVELIVPARRLVRDRYRSGSRMAATFCRSRSSADNDVRLPLPQFGGHGGRPADAAWEPRNIEFHVTSLDVIHSFSAYLLGVKANANPNVDNVAYTTTDHTGKFVIRCNWACAV